MVTSRKTITLIGAVLAFAAMNVVGQDCPELVGRWPFGPARAVAVSGDYAYFSSGAVLLCRRCFGPRRVAGCWRGFSAQRDIGTWPSPAATLTSWISIDGLWVIDVSTPASPIEVGFVDIPGVAQGCCRLRQLRLRRGSLRWPASYRRLDARKPD